jgi:hypothetical protein
VCRGLDTQRQLTVGRKGQPSQEWLQQCRCSFRHPALVLSPTTSFCPLSPLFLAPPCPFHTSLYSTPSFPPVLPPTPTPYFTLRAPVILVNLQRKLRHPTQYRIQNFRRSPFDSALTRSRAHYRILSATLLEAQGTNHLFVQASEPRHL